MIFGWDGDTIAFESSDKRSVHYVHEAGSFVPLAQATRQGPIALTASVGAKELMGANGRYDIDRDPLWNGEADKPSGPGFTKEEIAYYQADHLGTPQELTDHEGNIAWSAQYKAWGQAREVISDAARKAGIANPIRFQGQYWDEETGLHYNRHRYYDPSSGRFISKDPIGLDAGPHLYQFAPNPLEWIDPLGLAKLTVDKSSKSWSTPGGVTYGQGSVHGNRVKHVLDHEAPNPTKPKHSVFNVCKRGQSLQIVDEAWKKRGVATSSGPNDVYEVDMGRCIGTAGERKVRIVTKKGTNQIVTAFPIH